MKWGNIQILAENRHVLCCRCNECGHVFHSSLAQNASASCNLIFFGLFIAFSDQIKLPNRFWVHVKPSQSLPPQSINNKTKYIASQVIASKHQIFYPKAISQQNNMYIMYESEWRGIKYWKRDMMLYSLVRICWNCIECDLNSNINIKIEILPGISTKTKYMKQIRCFQHLNFEWWYIVCYWWVWWLICRNIERNEWTRHRASWKPILRKSR